METNKHLISKYLSGELDSETTARFEESLLTDVILQDELNLHSQIDNAIADTEVLNLRLQLEAMHEPLTRSVGRSSGRSYKRVSRYTAVAASVLILLGFSLLGVFRESNIIDLFYKPYDMTMVSRSADFDVDLTIQEAMLKYDNQQYREAVILFERVMESEPDMLSNYLFSGISYMEIDEFNRAEKNLQHIIDHRDNLYIEQAEWYIGFCYILTDRREKAVKHFSAIVNSDGFYSSKAKEILKKLN